MKPLNELLAELRQRNVRLWLEGERLRYKAPKDALTPELLAEVKSQKSEIIAFLKNVQASANSNRPSLIPISKQAESFPLSLAQQRLWNLYQLDPSSGAYNMPMAYRLIGSVDFPLLQQSFSAVCQRQKILCFRFQVLDGHPHQIIDQKLEPEIQLIDLKHIPSELKETEARKRANDEAFKPFDLEKGPLVRLIIFRLEPEMSIMLTNLHAIICDGSSSDIFLQDLIAFYRAFATDNPVSLSPLSIQYSDYAHWQQQWLQGSVYESQLNYWKEKFREEVSLLTLPTDRPRPFISSGTGERCYQILPKSLNEALNALSQQCGVTLFMLLLTAFKILLYRYSQKNDILVSFASAGRSQVEVEQLVGLFSNTLPLRTNPSGTLSFRDFLEQIQKATLEAFSNQDIPFDRLITELPVTANQKRSPFLQITYALNPPWKGEQGGFTDILPGLQVQSLFGYVHSGRLPYDLTLVMRETPTGLRTIFEYDTDLFDGTTVKRMIGHFQTLLEGIVANPDQRISDFKLLTVAEEQQLLVEWNKTNTIYFQNASIPEVFEAQVAANPEAIAIVSKEVSLTYGDLNQRSNQLAHFLRQLGLTTEMPVGIYLDKSPAVLVAILGILKAGGSYIPLDPCNSIEYLLNILEDTQAQFVLTQQSLATDLSNVSAKIIYLDTEEPILQKQSYKNLSLSATSNTVACIIYPKKNNNSLLGICITHQSIVQLVKSNRQWKLEADTIILHRDSIASEIAFFELFGALLNGGTTVIAPSEISATQISELVQTYQVNTLWLPTRLFHQLVNGYLDYFKSVRILLIGGDILSIACTQKLLKVLPNCTLINTFGLPENTGFTCSYTLKSPLPRDVLSFIGIPVDNTQVYVLDSYQQPVPVGTVGEFYVTGEGLAKGYCHRPELNANQFVLNPFNPDSDARLFRTGQFVRYLPDGNLAHAQVPNVSGIILETEINTYNLTLALHQHPKILETVVVIGEDLSFGKNYVAYIVPTGLQTLDTNELRDFLKQQGIITQQLFIVFVFLSTLPITSQGKVDYQALPIPDFSSHAAEKNAVAPQNDIEKKLVSIWEEILITRQISIQDNYFELGGNSIQAVQLFSCIEQVFGKKLPLSILFQAPTIEKLAKILTQEQDLVSWSSLVSIQPNGTKLPFFCVHGIGGDVISFYNLSHHLDHNQPLYGLQARGLNGEQEPFTVMEDMAAYYIEEIRTVQPEGPYFLGGLSSGGIIAFEMARQLRSQGQRVNLLVLFDSLGPKYYEPLSFRNWFIRHTSNFLKAKQEDRLEYLLGGLKSWNNRLKNLLSRILNQNYGNSRSTSHLDKQVKLIAIRASNGEEFYLRDSGVLSATEQAIRNYKPQPYHGKYLMLRSQEKSWWSATDHDLGWGNLLDNKESEIYEPPGHHYNMFVEPNVKIIAKKLKTCFDHNQ